MLRFLILIPVAGLAMFAFAMAQILIGDDDVAMWSAVLTGGIATYAFLRMTAGRRTIEDDDGAGEVDGEVQLSPAEAAYRIGIKDLESGAPFGGKSSHCFLLPHVVQLHRETETPPDYGDLSKTEKAAMGWIFRAAIRHDATATPDEGLRETIETLARASDAAPEREFEQDDLDGAEKQPDHPVALALAILEHLSTARVRSGLGKPVRKPRSEAAVPVLVPASEEDEVEPPRPFDRDRSISALEEKRRALLAADEAPLPSDDAAADGRESRGRRRGSSDEVAEPLDLRARLLDIEPASDGAREPGDPVETNAEADSEAGTEADAETGLEAGIGGKPPVSADRITGQASDELSDRDEKADPSAGDGSEPGEEAGRSDAPRKSLWGRKTSRRKSKSLGGAETSAAIAMGADKDEDAPGAAASNGEAGEGDALREAAKALLPRSSGADKPPEATPPPAAETDESVSAVTVTDDALPVEKAPGEAPSDEGAKSAEPDADETKADEPVDEVAVLSVNEASDRQAPDEVPPTVPEDDVTKAPPEEPAPEPVPDTPPMPDTLPGLDTSTEADTAPETVTKPEPETDAEPVPVPERAPEPTAASATLGTAPPETLGEGRALSEAGTFLWLESYPDPDLWQIILWSLDWATELDPVYCAWVVQRPECDRATAADLFIALGGFEVLGVARDEMPDLLPAGPEFAPVIREIVDRCAGSGYERSELRCEFIARGGMTLEECRGELANAASGGSRLPAPVSLFAEDFPDRAPHSRFALVDGAIVLAEVDA